LSGGSSSGVSVSIRANDAENIGIIQGDGITDTLNFYQGDFDLQSGSNLSGIETITLTEVNTEQTISFIEDNASATGINSIIGTLDDNGINDDQIRVSGDPDLAGFTFSNIEAINLSDGGSTRQTVGADRNSNFGLTKIQNFETGPRSGQAGTDVFDYKSDLVAGDGTVVLSSSDFTLTTIDSAARATNIISANSTGIIEFETTNLNVTTEITDATSLNQILSLVESLLESTNASTNLTGTSAGVTNGAANTDSLLVFYDNDSDDNAVIIRYQEGSIPDADYSGELSVVAVFDRLENFGSSDDTFNDANIV
jgi:hypothetical protein